MFKILNIILLVITSLIILYYILFGNDIHESIHVAGGLEILKNEKPIVYNAGKIIGPLMVILQVVDAGFALLSLLIGIIVAFNKEFKKDIKTFIIFAVLLYCFAIAMGLVRPV